jgi:hypothetical protein
MLQIPNHQLFNKGKTYANFAELYLPESAYHLAIAATEQQDALQQLDTQIKKEQFYTVTDVKTGAITQCNGINQWLGFTDAHFTQKKYLAAINPLHLVVQGFYAAALFEVLINKQISPQFLQPACTTALALKNKNGKYFYCKRQCSPFQLTADKRMTAYISEFTLIKEYDNEAYHSKIYDDVAAINNSNEILKKAAGKKFEATKSFSVQELRILKRYAASENIKSEHIAKAFKIEKTTVDTYNKRILKKAENIFGQRFENAKNAAGYFKRVGLI